MNQRKSLPIQDCFDIIDNCFGGENVEIKSKYIDFKDINQNAKVRGFNISMDGEHIFANHPNELDSFAEQETEVIEDKYFVNYDPFNRRLVNIGKLQEQFTDWELSPIILCMLCEQVTPKNRVIEHLKECVGLDFEIDENLPAYKINFN